MGPELSHPHYRYELRREWMGAGGIVNFIMLNPSTADDIMDDPTIRKCCGFAKRWGYRGIVVTNLFAMRATHPSELLKVSPKVAIGERNDGFLQVHAWASQAIVCAWGDSGRWYGRASEVAAALSSFDLGCIGMTHGRQPLHPCRAAYTSAPEVFRIASATRSA